MLPPLTTVTVSLPPPPQCAAEGCEETKLKSRGLCRRHYVSAWLKGEHVFRPQTEQKPIEQVRIFLYREDLKGIQALARARGLSRSELIREVVHGLLQSVQVDRETSVK